MYITYVLFAIFIYSFINYLDKFLISKYCKDVSEGVLLIFSGLIGLPVAFAIVVFGVDPNQFSRADIFLLILAGFFYIITLIPYMYAIGAGDVSSVVPTFLMMPVFSLSLGYVFLSEQITLFQLLLMIIVVICAVAISFSTNEAKSLKFNKKMFLASMIYSFGISSMAILFKEVAVDANYWAAQFWYQIGYFLAAIFLLVIPQYRNSFTKIAFGSAKKSVWGINFSAEAITNLGDIAYRYATMLGVVAVVQTVALGLQPIIVFILAIFFSVFFPRFSSEVISKSELIRKLMIIIIMVLAVYKLQSI